MKPMGFTTRELAYVEVEQYTAAACACGPPGEPPPGFQLDRDDYKFVALTGLIFAGPAIAYCITVGRWWPIYWMVCTLILGLVLGLIMYTTPNDDFVSCVSTTRFPMTPVSSRRPAQQNPSWLAAIEEIFV